MSSSISISDLRSASFASRHRRVIAFLAMLACGAVGTLLLFVAAAAFGLRDAMILRDTKQAIEFKLAPLMAPDRPPYLMVIAGSNGVYSIDSATLRRLTGMPVANLAIQWSYTAYVFERALELIRPGDVILLPLEYEYFSSIEGRSRLEACYRITEDRRSLSSVVAFVSALSDCSPMLIVDGLLLQAAVTLGMHKPVFDPLTQMTPEGDMRENVAGANHYRRKTGRTFSVPEERPFGNPRFADMIRAAVSRGARVFLSYPVRPEKSGSFPLVSADWIEQFQHWAENLNAKVISTPEDHVFPIGCFFDAPYHLNQACTPRNSEIYASALRPYLK